MDKDKDKTRTRRQRQDKEGERQDNDKTNDRTNDKTKRQNKKSEQKVKCRSMGNRRKSGMATYAPHEIFDFLVESSHEVLGPQASNEVHDVISQ